MSRVLKVGNNTIAQVLSRKRRPVAQKIVNTALDGTAYVQTTGGPVWRYEVYIFCATLEEREAVDEACYEGAEVTLIFDDLTVNGFIESEAVSWREWVDEHGVGSFVLIKK